MVPHHPTLPEVRQTVKEIVTSESPVVTNSKCSVSPTGWLDLVGPRDHGPGPLPDDDVRPGLTGCAFLLNPTRLGVGRSYGR